MKKKLTKVYNPDVDEVVDEDGKHYYAADEVDIAAEKAILLEILKELKGLRNDAKKREKEAKTEFDTKLQALDDYKKWVTDLMANKSNTQNLGQLLMPNMSLDELKKNTADMIKNMMNPQILEQMPEPFKNSYFKLMQGIMKPNDEAFDDVQPDPREPIEGYYPEQLTPKESVLDERTVEVAEDTLTMEDTLHVIKDMYENTKKIKEEEEKDEDEDEDEDEEPVGKK